MAASRRVRVAVYTRVSTHLQTVEHQSREIGEYLERRGIPEADVTRFTETVSGVKARRTEFQSLRQAVQRRAVDVIVVSRLDRLGRKLSELVTFLDELAEHRVGFVSLHEGFDTTTSAGRLMMSLVGAFAEYERNLLSERTREGLATAVARGKKLGRRPDVAGKLSAAVVGVALAEHGSVARASLALGVSVWSFRKALKLHQAQDMIAQQTHPVRGAAEEEKGV